MAIEPTAAVLGEVTKYAHRNSRHLIQLIIDYDDEVLWNQIVETVMNDERHAQARAALDILWDVGLRDGGITLAQLVAAAEWSPPGSEA